MLRRLVIFLGLLGQWLVSVLPGVVLCIVLAKGGDALASFLGLRLPGAALGLMVFSAWLASGRGIGWSRAGALLLARWIGAALVPVLVGLTAYAALVAGVAGKLMLLLVVTTAVTGVATTLIYRGLARWL